MATVTEDQLQRYISMAQDVQTYRGFDKQIKRLEDRMQSQDPSPSVTYKLQLQEQLDACQKAQQLFPEMMRQKYNVQSFNDLGKQMRKMEPDIDKAYQQQTAYEKQVAKQQYAGVHPTVDTYMHQQEQTQAYNLPQDKLTTAYALMHQEQQRRQDAKAGDPRYQQFAAKNLPNSQSAQQQTSQPMSDQELIKKVQDFHQTMQRFRQLQAAEQTGQVQMQAEGKAYLDRQAHIVANGFKEFLDTHRDRIAQMPADARVLNYTPYTHAELTILARRMDTEGLQRQAAQVKQQRQEQGIVHPEKSSLDRQLEEKTREINERKAQERAQGRTRGKGGPEH